MKINKAEVTDFTLLIAGNLIWKYTRLMSGLPAFYIFFSIFSHFFHHNKYSSSYKLNTVCSIQIFKVEFHKAYVWGFYRFELNIFLTFL